MKKTILLLICSLVGLSVQGQYSISDKQLDSLTQLLAKATEDTVKFELHMQLGVAGSFVNPNKAVHEYSEALKIARKLGEKPRIAGCLLTFGFLYGRIGEPAKAIEMHQEVLRYAEEANEDISMPLAFISYSYEAQGDLKNALDYQRRSFMAYEKLIKDPTFSIDPRGYVAGPMRSGILFEKLGQLDSAMYYGQLSYQRILENQKGMSYFYCTICNLLGAIYSRLNQPEEAIRFYRLALNKATEENAVSIIHESQTALAKFYQKTNQPDSAIYYAAQAYEGAQKIKGFEVMRESAALLRTVYEKQANYAKALYYNDLSVAARDSVSGAEKVREVQNLTYKEERRQEAIQQEIEAQKIAYKNKIRIYSLLAVLLGLLLLATVLYRNNQQKQKANALLQAQKEEIETQKIQLQTSLETLKATQTQLIQSEKLASLGEMTAGIAHEIQNPLNFVTNFSELSVDLAKELKDEMDKVTLPENDKDYIAELLADLGQNQEKINLHGKRAASIVTAMLQHARTSIGTKESTELNALAEEYLRLAYHGLRAKNTNFNAKIITDFDPAIEKVDVIPQDMGRVLLNLINNAFYAVHQRASDGVTSSHPFTTQGGKTDLTNFENLANLSPYQPTVTISTQNTDNQIIIKIKDNGTGIPDDVKAKIFQPFFTTKPTGQGTGLGLSLAYDIVVKGHGGTLEVESVAGVGTEFVIKLPGK